MISDQRLIEAAEWTVDTMITAKKNTSGLDGISPAHEWQEH